MIRIALDLPDFATLSDEAIQHHPFGRTRDGRWSSLTKAILEHFGTERLSLNAAWADTWDQWTCPCCHRGKFQIARLTAGNIVLCQLDWHHDHLRDLAKKIFREYPGIGLADELRTRRSRAQAEILALIPRFSDALLCADCNQAEGAMKAALGKVVDPFFSFSPSEISTFIVASPNAPHERRIEAGAAAFERAIPVFRERMAFAHMMAVRLNDGLLDCEHTLHGGYDPGDDRDFIYRLACEAAHEQGRRITLATDLHSRSRAADGGRASVRGRRSDTAIAPTPAEFRELNAERLISPPWKAVGEGWRCTICDRSKTEFARKSKRNRWTAGVQTLNTFALEKGERNLAYRSRRQTANIVLGSHKPFFLCQDCRQIVTDAVKLGGKEDCFTPDDLRRLVGAPAHNRSHGAAQNDIRSALAANADWQRAVADYWGHHQRAIELVAYHRMLLARGYSESEARSHLLNTYLAQGISDPLRTSDEFEWLLGEGRRFRP